MSLAPADALRDPARLGRVLALGLPNGVSSLLAECAGSFSNRLLVLTVGFGAAFAVACLIGHDALLRLFLSDPEALALGRSLLPWLLLGSPLFGVYYLGVNFLQASGRAAATTVLSALRQGALLLPALVPAARAAGPAGPGSRPRCGRYAGCRHRRTAVRRLAGADLAVLKRRWT